MDLYIFVVNIFIGILLAYQGTAKRLVKCKVNNLRDFCGFQQDRSDSFDWTIKLWILDVRRAAPEEPHSYYLNAAKSASFGRAGQNAILHTPFYRVQTQSTLSIRFRLRIDTADDTMMNLFVSQKKLGKAKIVHARSRGRGWREEFRNVTVMEPFRLSFEAVLGSGARSAVSVDDIELDMFPQTIQTGNNIPKGTTSPATKPAGDKGNEKKDKDEESSGKDDSMPLCFVIALISTSILAVFLITCMVLCVYAIRNNSFTKRSGHQYEVIYSEQSTTQSSMESSLQLSLRRQRRRTRSATSTSSKLLHRISCSMSSARDSNQSSIYAEIAETDDGESREDEDGQVEVFIVGTGSTKTTFENSFFSTLSATSSEETMVQEPLMLNIPEKVREALFLPYLPQNVKVSKTSPVIPWRAPQEVDTGWVDNIIYEGSFESNNVSGRQIIGLQTLRPQPSAKEVDIQDNRTRGFTF